jgi:hypothetical protein
MELHQPEKSKRGNIQMGEYADMEISRSFEDYMRNNDYDYRQNHPGEFDDLDGEIIYKNKNTGEVLIDDIKAGKEITNKKCKSCGGNLIIRQNKTTSQFFVGCSNFPKCRQTYYF